MKALLRWGFNLAAAVSLVVAIMIIGLWIRCRFVSDGVSWRGGTSGQVWSNDHAIYLQVTVPAAARGGSPTSWGYRKQEASANRHLPLWRRFLPSWRAGPMDVPGADWDRVLTIPFWLPLILSGLLPLVWIHFRRRAQRSLGHCSNCGYDLRATPERCPECGAIPEAAKGATT